MESRSHGFDGVFLMRFDVLFELGSLRSRQIESFGVFVDRFPSQIASDFVIDGVDFVFVGGDEDERVAVLATCVVGFIDDDVVGEFRRAVVVGAGSAVGVSDVEHDALDLLFVGDVAVGFWEALDGEVLRSGDVSAELFFDSSQDVDVGNGCDAVLSDFVERGVSAEPVSRFVVRFVVIEVLEFVDEFLKCIVEDGDVIAGLGDGEV